MKMKMKRQQQSQQQQLQPKEEDQNNNRLTDMSKKGAEGKTAEPHDESVANLVPPEEDDNECKLPPTKKFKDSENEAVSSPLDEIPRFLPPVVALPSIASLVSVPETKPQENSAPSTCPLPPLSEPDEQVLSPTSAGSSVSHNGQKQEKSSQKQQLQRKSHFCGCDSQQSEAQSQECKENDSMMKLDCRKSMLVSELKRHIEAKTGILFDHQMLIFNGQRLCDTNTLREVGLDKDSMVHLVVQIRKPSAVPHTPSDQSHSLSDN